MHAIRHRLAALVVAVMACQLTGAVGTPVAFGAAIAAEARGTDELTCTCVHAPSAECPMHKKKPAAPADEDRWCKGCHEGAGAVLTTIADFVGPLVERQRAVAPAGVSAAIIAVPAHSLNLAHPPASPPPRA